MSNVNTGEVVVKEIGGTSYVLKLFPTRVGLRIMQSLEREGFTPDVICDTIVKGCSIGSSAMSEAKFDSHFKGKYKEMMELFAEILKYNNLFPEDGEEGNEEGSEE